MLYAFLYRLEQGRLVSGSHFRISSFPRNVLISSRFSTSQYANFFLLKLPIKDSVHLFSFASLPIIRDRCILKLVEN